MPNQTTNYNLTKPLETERYDVQVFNNNADIIDAQMKSNSDGIVNVNSRLDNLNNWTTVEFTLANFTYDENSGITYLRTEAPSGYEIAEIKGYFVLNKVETDSTETTTVMDVTKPQHFSELNGTLLKMTHSATALSLTAILEANINLDLLYTQSMVTYSPSSVRRDWATSPVVNYTGSFGRSIIPQKFETTSFTIKTNIPYINLHEFYGRLQYRAVPAPELTL